MNQSEKTGNLTRPSVEKPLKTQSPLQEDNAQPALADLEPREQIQGGINKTGAGTLILSSSNTY